MLRDRMTRRSDDNKFVVQARENFKTGDIRYSPGHKTKIYLVGYYLPLCLSSTGKEYPSLNVWKALFKINNYFWQDVNTNCRTHCARQVLCLKSSYFINLGFKGFKAC